MYKGIHLADQIRMICILVPGFQVLPRDFNTKGKGIHNEIPLFKCPSCKTVKTRCSVAIVEPFLLELIV
jgi:hypothetical protein